MNEMNDMSCAEFQDVAAELALGVLTGRERARALGHLDHCEACRENVRQLTLTGEGLLGLLPSAEPPVGFETRVLDRIGVTAPPDPVPAAPRRPLLGRTRRMLAVAATVIAIAGGGLAGWGLRGATWSPAPAALHSAALVSATHHAVGKIFLYRGHPHWVYMSVNMPGGQETVICQLRSRGGHFTTVGSFRLTSGYGYWGSPAPAGQLTGARLVTTSGTVLATASFS